MKRILIALGVAAAATPALPPLVPAAATSRPAAATSRPAAHVLAYAQEWSLWPSRTSVPAGRVVVQLWNRGQDAHDVRIRHVDRRGHMSGTVQGVSVTASGGLGQASWQLRPGRYELYCSLPGHRQQGMRAVITVR